MGPRKNIAAIKNPALVSFSIILFFLFIEACLTAIGFNPESDLLKYDMNRRFYNADRGKGKQKEEIRCSRDPLLFWRLIPRRGEVNSAGFRSKKEYSLTRGPDTKRIICLGDSITYGVWVKIEETYPYLLEQMLNANSDAERFEVINAGVMGYSSLQGLRKIKRDLLKYKPDLVIAFFGFDDNYPAIFYSDKEQKTYNKYVFYLKKIFRKSKLYCLLELSLLRARDSLGAYRNHTPQAVLRSAKRRVEPEEYKVNLEQMVKMSGENDFGIFFLTPSILNLETKEVDYLDDYQGQIPQGHIIDITRELKERYGRGRLFLDSCHFTPTGHWVVAKAIYDTLVEKRIVGPKQQPDISMPVYAEDYLPEEIKQAGLKSYIKMGENDVGALTFGWLELEKIGDMYARFTGGYANAYLNNYPADGEDRRLRIGIFSYIHNKTSVFVNDNCVATVECLPNQWQEAEIAFKDSARFLKVSICPEKIFKPSVEFGSQDDRTLGVAVSKIEIIRNNQPLNKIQR